MNTNPTLAGVINPLALAELILDQPVNEKRPDIVKATLEKAFQMPLEELLNPRKGSLLYLFIELDEKGRAIPRKFPTDLPKRSVKEIDEYCWTLGLKGYRDLPFLKREKLIWILLKGIPETVGVANLLGWRDPGDFFEEGTEYADPVQGAIGDCYLIAALSAIAWARPYGILHRTRATGHGQELFVDRIDIREVGPGTISQIEVNERVPCNPDQSLIYARSAETNEIWPAIYEKAYSRWRNRNNGGGVNYPGLSGGDALYACCELMPELSMHRVWNDATTADDIWKFIRDNCMSRRTVNPMVAHTYYSDEHAGASYAGSGIVPGHAYSILGISQNDLNRARFVVVRNPWGWNFDVPNEQTGTWQAFDNSFWRNVPLKANGVFAIPLADFKRFFWTTDAAK
jgi:hypothetical protein